MSKSLYLAALLFLPFSVHFNAQEISSSDASITLDHITQEKKVIFLELKTILELFKKAEEYFQRQLGDSYETALHKANALLIAVVNSKEFSFTLEKVTDYQIKCIVFDTMKYNSIIIDPSSYPLEQKIKDLLAEAQLDEKTTQLFNVLYVVMAVTLGSKVLLYKLAIHEKELAAQQEISQEA